MVKFKDYIKRSEIGHFILILCLIHIFSSCKIKEEIVQSHSKINYKTLNTLIQENEKDYEYFNAKAQVNYNQQSFTANIRMKKDSLIWISFTGPFNIEGARVLISPHRFQMIDKINKNYYDKPLNFVENFIPIDINLRILQNIIIGHFFEDRLKRQKIETIDDAYVVQGNISSLESLYQINKNGILQRAEIEDKTKNIRVNISYDKLNNQFFSTRRIFEFYENNEKKILTLKFFRTNLEKIDYPFEIPKKYTEI